MRVMRPSVTALAMVDSCRHKFFYGPIETNGGSDGTIILRTISDAYLNRIPILNEAGEISVHSHIDRHVTTANGRIRGVYNPTTDERNTIQSRSSGERPMKDEGGV